VLCCSCSPCTYRRGRGQIITTELDGFLETAVELIKCSDSDVVERIEACPVRASSGGWLPRFWEIGPNRPGLRHKSKVRSTCMEYLTVP